MKSVNLIGIGRHAKLNIIPALQHLGVTIESVTTHSKEKALLEMQRCGIVADVYDDIDVMLNESKSEYVIVVVPMEEASSCIIRCLEKGKKVFTEKPCGLDNKQAQAIYNCSRDTHIPVFTGYMKRYAPVYTMMKEHIKKADMGLVRSFNAHFNVDASAFCKTDKDFMFAVASHYLDLIQFLFEDIQDIHAIKNTQGKGVSYILTMVMSNGIIGTLSLENRAPWTRESEGITCTMDGGFIQSNELNEFILHKNCLDNDWKTLSEQDLVYKENYSPASGTLKDLYLRGFVQEIEAFVNDEIQDIDNNIKLTLVLENIIQELKNGDH
ncbi:Gfo/Idh/MocA family protein [Anaerorhabdus sp.]|uniref:Gfo/Idh/MocA family protein n=1 Tax=Anaerorhabdus sp. TaxID=1872524 RepID=UPI002FC7AA25